MSRVIDDCPCCGAPLRPQEASCAYCGAYSRVTDEAHGTEVLDAFSATPETRRARQRLRSHFDLVPIMGIGPQPLYYAPVMRQGDGVAAPVSGRLHRLTHPDWVGKR